MTYFWLEFCDDDRLWDDFILHSRHGSPFCLSWYLRACSEYFERWFVCSSKGILAAVPVFPDEGGNPKPVPRPYAMYQGLMLANGTAKLGEQIQRDFDIVEFAISQLMAKYGSISLAQRHGFSDIRPFLWWEYGKHADPVFSTSVSYTALLHLDSYSDFGAYLDALGSKKKGEYRRAFAAGLNLASNVDVTEFIRLYVANMKANGVSLSGASVCQVGSIIEAALLNNSGEFVAVRNSDGALVSANFILFCTGTAYYLFGASDPEKKNQFSGLCCMLESIRNAMEKEISVFDMVGVNSPTRGFFKTKFGAEPVSCWLISSAKRS